MTPYDRAWDMGVYAEYMWVYDGICQVVRIPDGCSGRANLAGLEAGSAQAGTAAPAVLGYTGPCHDDLRRPSVTVAAGPTSPADSPAGHWQALRGRHDRHGLGPPSPPTVTRSQRPRCRCGPETEPPRPGLRLTARLSDSLAQSRWHSPAASHHLEFPPPGQV